MQSVIDTFREQMQKQQLPMVEFQRQWLAAMEAVMETELEAVRQYWDTWFRLSQACIHSGDDNNPVKLGQDCADLFCQLNKAMLEHAHKRQQLTQNWRDRLTEIM
ncbi:phasin family protein [Marinospirillum alkaliphilum]|uniref:Phasin family protein n=1 Tax=Marinospirillum alkaliphilum DSM 21637 TaxID=1122209 RepID=A0A1K1TDB4_9GAMM|nr:phasin family protein [Marinospirillum alkaliphilum]SFW98420.1 phasin family protein [Marinospirillum alkaliphilum DSM 21637]